MTENDKQLEEQASSAEVGDPIPKTAATIRRAAETIRKNEEHLNRVRVQSRPSTSSVKEPRP